MRQPTVSERICCVDKCTDAICPAIAASWNVASTHRQVHEVNPNPQIHPARVLPQTC